MKRLVLFDIDGTLLTTNGQAIKAMMAAYRDVYGCNAVEFPYRMDGKTELQITHELLALGGLTRAQVQSRLPVFWPHYAEALDRYLTPETTTVHPGVAELIQKVAADPDTVLGLLTGKCEAAAQKKLKCARLDGFVVGAYGDRHERRDELPLVAVQAAERVTGRRFGGKEIVILGDTPNDVECGRALGVKAIGVATGRYKLDELAQYAPDAVFPTFADVSAVLRAINVS